MRAHGLALRSVDVKLGKTRRIVDKNKANILAVQTAATQLSQRVDALKATVDANDNNAQTQARRLSLHVAASASVSLTQNGFARAAPQPPGGSRLHPQGHQGRAH
jgi:hypothetical protein